MLNLINLSPHKVLEQISLKDYRAHCGLLSTPRSWRLMERAISYNVPWAIDNDCFNNYDAGAILRYLNRCQGLPNCLFAVLPDVVGNHEQTKILSMAWLGTYQKLNYPPAFVLQNGCTVDDVPYDSLAAIFIGGDNTFKESETAKTIAIEAKKRGLWVHAGRVGGKRRLRKMRDEFKIDSYDSSGFSIYPPKIKSFIIEHEVRQLTLGI